MPDHFRIGMGVNTEMFAEGLNRIGRALAIEASTQARSYGRGAGVGRDRGVGVALGVIVGEAVGVGVGVASGAAKAYTLLSPAT